MCILVGKRAKRASHSQIFSIKICDIQNSTDVILTIEERVKKVEHKFELLPELFKCEF